MHEELIQKLNVLLLDNAVYNKRYVKLPPILLKNDNLLQVVTFLFHYYQKRKITLKNHKQFITFDGVTISKVHNWLSTLLYNLRISLLLMDAKNDDQKIEKAYNLFSKKLPRAPLIIKSALKKYQYIPINNWTKEQFEYCCRKELHDLNNEDIPGGFILDSLYKENEITESLKNFINISEILEGEGNYDLSEKILTSTEQLCSNLGLEK